MQLDNPKFCRDCKHYEPLHYAALAYCRSPNAPADLVTGRHIEVPDSARLSMLKCGPEAKWFEPKHAREPKRPWWRLLCK